MKKILISILAACAFTAMAADPLINQTGACPAGETITSTGSCTVQNQQLGDTNSAINNTGDVRSPTTQMGNSAASNVSGNDLVFDNKAQTTQNATTTTAPITTTITGGSTDSKATGGAAIGNDAKLDANLQVGPLTTGPSSAAVGPIDVNVAGSSTGPVSSGSAAGISGSGNSHVKTGGASAAGGSGGAGGGGGSVGPVQASTKTDVNNDNASAAKSSADGSGNATTIIDTSNRGVYNSKTMFIPAIVPPTPPSQMAIGGIIKETSACGPLQRVVNSEVLATFHGLTGKDHDHMGYSQDLAPYVGADGRVVMYHTEEFADGSGYQSWGHQVTETTAIVGVTGARNLTLGGGSSNGAWAQGGGGSSQGAQRMVTTIRLRLCALPHVYYKQAPLVEQIAPAPEYKAPRADRQ